MPATNHCAKRSLAKVTPPPTPPLLTPAPYYPAPVQVPNTVPRSPGRGHNHVAGAGAGAGARLLEGS